MTFRFGDTVHKILSQLTFDIPVPKITAIKTTVKVFNADTSLFLGLEWSHERKFVAEKVHNRLVSSEKIVP